METEEAGTSGVTPGGGKPASKARATKTPLQKEVLEASYQLNQFPSEEHRRALGERIELTEQQVQVWFTNRRRRDKRHEGKLAAAHAAAITPAVSAAPQGATPSPSGPHAQTSQQQAAVANSLDRPAAPHSGRPAASPCSQPPGQQLSGSGGGGAFAYVPQGTSPHPHVNASAGCRAAAPSGSARQPPDQTLVPPAPGGALTPSSMAYSDARLDSSYGADGTGQGGHSLEQSEDAKERSFSETLELLEAAKAALPVPYREDGPPLAVDFDDPPLPPGTATAAAAGGAGGKRKRNIVFNDFVAETEGGVMGLRKRASSSQGGGDMALSNAALLAAASTAEEREALRRKMDLERLERRRADEQRRLEKDAEKAVLNQRKIETTMRKEQDRLKRELSKQQEKLERDRRKDEEDRAREMERQQKEKAKLTERMEKDKAKEEQKRLRELEKLRASQEKELRRLEAQRERERKAEERRKAVEERRKGVGGVGAAGAGSVGAAGPPPRIRVHIGPARSRAAGPPDDEELEMSRLLEAQCAAGEGSDTEERLAGGGSGRADDVVRPPFPPPELRLQPGFPPQLGDAAGSTLLMAWSFLHSFSDILGLRPCTVDQLAAAVYLGEDSPLLSDLHVSLLRLLQADMEEAHHHHAALAVAHSSGASKAERGGGQLLEEVWQWGFDIDVWRAHLNVHTWPEVLRQFAIVAGAGRRRPRARPESRAKLGAAGEDLVEENGQLRLKLPSRFGHGTMKAAAWQVLTDVGPQGLMIDELARRIQKAGLRDLRTSKTPEASVANALSRDVVFVRTAPATYALQSVIAHDRRLRGGTPAEAAAGAAAAAQLAPKSAPDARHSSWMPGTPGAAAAAPTSGGAEMSEVSGAVKSQPQEDVRVGAGAGITHGPGTVRAEAVDLESSHAAVRDASMASATAHVKQEPAAGTPSLHQHSSGTGPGTSAQHQGQDEEGGSSSDEEKEEDEEERECIKHGDGLPWVAALATTEYNVLAVPDRLAALHFLVQCVVESHTVRAKLDERESEAQRLRKLLMDDAKDEKRRRQVEATERARIAAEEATRRLEEFQRTGVVPPPSSTAIAAASGHTSHRAAAVDALFSDRAALVGMDPESAARMATDAAEIATRAQMDDEEKLRRQQRLEALQKVEEEYALRPEPIGLDRRHNRYWRFQASDDPHADPNAGRLWIEDGSTGNWCVLTEAWQLEDLRALLDPRGMREGPLHAALVKHEEALRAAMPSTALSMPRTLNELEEDEILAVETAAADRRDAVHTQAEVLLAGAEDDYAADMELLPSDSMRVRKLKQDLLRIESVLPTELLDETFTANRFDWIGEVQSAPGCAELRSCLGQLEVAISQKLLSPAYVRRPLLVKGAWVPVGMEVASAVVAATGEVQQLSHRAASAGGGTIAPNTEPLAWLPPTLAAISLRLQALDAAITYNRQTCGRDYLAGYRYTLRPAPPTDDDCDDYEDDLRPLPCKLVYGNPITSQGRTRLPQLFPILGGEIMAFPPHNFDLPVDDLRREVAEAEAQGRLKPGTDSSAPRTRITLTRPGASATKGALATTMAVTGTAAGAGAVGGGAAGGKAKGVGAGSKPKVGSSKSGSGRSSGKGSTGKSSGGAKSRRSSLAKQLAKSSEDEPDDYGPEEEEEDAVQYAYGAAVPAAARLAGGTKSRKPPAGAPVSRSEPPPPVAKPQWAPPTSGGVPPPTTEPAAGQLPRYGYMRAYNDEEEEEEEEQVASALQGRYRPWGGEQYEEEQAQQHRYMLMSEDEADQESGLEDE